jgi:hypothetical protein
MENGRGMFSCNECKGFTQRTQSVLGGEKTGYYFALRTLPPTVRLALQPLR